MKTKILVILTVFVFLFFLNTVFAQESKIWTDKEIYSEGDYVKVFIQLPEEKFSSCETYLINPSGYEFQKGAGGCAAGVTEHLDPRFMTEPKKVYKQTAMLTEFLSSYSEYLGENFGTWGIKVLAKKDDQVVKTLTTSFEYKYFNRIVGSCTLKNTKTKTCEFLGSSFEVTRNGDCGPNPVDITIKYFGGTKSLSLKQGETDMLPIGLIVVRNMGSPCAADVLNLRFDKLITVEETSLKISAEEKKIEAKIEGESKTYSLPSEEKRLIVEGRVEEIGKNKKIYISVDNVKEVLSLESENITADTKLPIGIEITQLYVEVNDVKSEVNILPDTVLEKAKTEVSSIESIEIKSGSSVYSVKGFRDARILWIFPVKLNMEIKIDTATGQIKEIEKPWWSFLAR